jgi:Leucine-rich repeat (LRR) protein
MSPNESAEVAAIPNDDDGLSPPPTFGDDNNDMASQTSAEAAARRRKYRKFTLSLLLGTMLLSTIVTAVRYYGNRKRNDDNNLSSQQQGNGSGGDEEGSDTAMVMTNGLDVEANTARIRQTLEFLISSAASASSTFSQGYDDTDTLATNSTANTADANNSDNFNFNNNNDNSESELTAMTDGTYTPQYAAALWIAKYDALLLDIPSTSSSSSSTSSTASTAEEDEYYYPFLQRYALAVLYFALSGPQGWIHKMNFLRAYHECNWIDSFLIDDGSSGMSITSYGLLCDGSKVTGISLPPMNNMSGTLPVEIRHLQYIKWLQIDKNINITGPIPYEMGTSMTDLQVISITECGLTGSIPSSFALLSNLFLIDFSHNNLTVDTTKGGLNFLANLSSLVSITLDYNPYITGSLPTNIWTSNLASTLRELSLSNTGLYGPLPTELSQLTKLSSLYLDDNAFTGSLTVLQSMTNLTHLYLEDNLWSTTLLDDNFFVELTQLKHLDMSNTSLRGPIPAHFFQLSSLEVLDLSNNQITGTLPTNISSGDSSSVNILLGGSLFGGIGSGSNLTYLSLHTNNITGAIPSSIGNLDRLITLDLSNNKFTGLLPVELGSLVNIEVLFLGKNNFTSNPIPEWIGNLGKTLTELSLKASSLTGTIPSWIGDKLPELLLLDLGQNGLVGTIPQELRNCVDMVVLILNSNKLTGQLGLGELRNLETILIDDNDLTGNTNAMCEHEIEYFISDCSKDPSVVGEIDCSCCTLCCTDVNVTCNDADWLANHEGICKFDTIIIIIHSRLIGLFLMSLTLHCTITLYF